MDRIKAKYPFECIVNDADSLADRACRAVVPNGQHALSDISDRTSYGSTTASGSHADEPLQGLFKGPRLSDRLR